MTPSAQVPQNPFLLWGGQSCEKRGNRGDDAGERGAQGRPARLGEGEKRQLRLASVGPEPLVSTGVLGTWLLLLRSMKSNYITADYCGHHSQLGGA